MLSAARIASLCLLLSLCAHATARDLHLLIVGDQSAANCHAHAYGAEPGIFVLNEKGLETPAEDPLVGADCRGGSVWMPLASRLKKIPGVDKVVLVPVAIENAKAGDWSTGRAGARLQNALAFARKNGFTFDYAIWQQGSADVQTSPSLYFEQMRRVVRGASISNHIRLWLIAPTPGCSTGAYGPYGPITEAQRLFSKQVVMNRFTGPVGTLPNPHRSCTLDASEQEVVADRWLDAIRHADKLSDRYQKESLLYFFGRSN